MMSTASTPPDPKTRLVRVLLVDDSAPVRQELRHLLELSGGVQIVGDAVNGLEAVRLSAELAPDVIVMDLEMPVLDGLEATRRIKACPPAPRVVILSVHAGPEVEQRIRESGADCFVAKGSGYQILVNAIRARDGSIHSFELGEGS